MSGTSLATVARQHGWIIQPDTDTHINRLDVRSETSTRLYRISQTRRNGIWLCECLGFRNHRRCKHLEAVVPVIEATLANPAPQPTAPAKPSAVPPSKIASPVRIVRERVATVRIAFDGSMDSDAVKAAVGAIFGTRVAKQQGVIAFSVREVV